MKNIITILILFISFNCFAQFSPGKITYRKNGNSVERYSPDTLIQGNDRLNGIDVRKYGFIAGYLETLYPTYTYQQLRTLRKANFAALESAKEEAVKYGTDVLLPAGRCEIYIVDSTLSGATYNGDRINFDTDYNVRIRGLGYSEVYVYPIVKKGFVQLFDMDRNLDKLRTKLTLENISFETEPFRLETYNVIFNVGGDPTKIQITDSYIRAEALTYLATSGKKLSNDPFDGSQGVDRTISSYNAGTKTITLSIALPTPRFTTDDVGIIGLAFEEDVELDTLRTYGQYWGESDSIDWKLIDYVYGFGTNDDTININLKNVTIKGFDTGISISNTSAFVNFQKGYVQSHVTGMTAFSSNSVARDIKINLYDVTFENNGFIQYGAGQGHAVGSLNNRFGGATYIHPNIDFHATRCKWINNVAVGHRHYSAGGVADNFIYPGSYTSFTDCEFGTNDEAYTANFSEILPVYITNCYFYGGDEVWVNGNNTFFKNCTFDNILISNTDVNAISNFDGCKFLNNSQFYSGSAEGQFIIHNSYIKPHTTAATFAIGSDFPYLELVDVLIDTGTTSSISLFGQANSPIKMKIVDSDIRFTGNLFDRTGATSATSIYNPKNRWELINSKFACTLGVANQGSWGDNFVSTNCTFAKTPYVYPAADDLQLRKKPNYNPVVATSIAYNPGGGHINYSSALTWEFEPNFNSFYVSGSPVRAFFVLDTTPQIAFDDEITLICTDAITIAAYDSVSTTTSNFKFSGTFARGDVIKMRFAAKEQLIDGTNTGTTFSLGTGNGTTRYFSSNGTLLADAIRNSIVITTSDGITLNDDFEGNITGTGGYGYVDYERQSIVVYFDTAPTNAATITVTYNDATTVHHRGCWYKTN